MRRGSQFHSVPVSARLVFFFFSICLRRARFPPSPGSNPCRVAQGMFFSSEGVVFRVKCSFLIRCWTNRFHVARCQYSCVTRFGGFFSARGGLLFHPFPAAKGGCLQAVRGFFSARGRLLFRPFGACERFCLRPRKVRFSQRTSFGTHCAFSLHGSIPSGFSLDKNRAQAGSFIPPARVFSPGPMFHVARCQYSSVIRFGGFLSRPWRVSFPTVSGYERCRLHPRRVLF